MLSGPSMSWLIPEIWRFIHHQRTRPRTIANSNELYFYHNTLGLSITTGFVEVSDTDVDHRGSFRFPVKLTLCLVLSQASPLSYPFVFVRTVFWVVAAVPTSDA